MTGIILTETTASVSELKRDPMGTVAAGDGLPVPAAAYEALMERLEDLELNAIADTRTGEPVVRVSIDAL
ncbi:MAG: plasmid stabilization protein [Betaproteobacteria bacterium]|nr:plasmid stabilization protein [Betaproteobacteria bacterium]